jgi:hypothetical protein
VSLDQHDYKERRRISKRSIKVRKENRQDQIKAVGLSLIDVHVTHLKLVESWTRCKVGVSSLVRKTCEDDRTYQP